MIQLTDDGTLDTVFRCTECGEEMRYTFAAGDEEDTCEEFVEWALLDCAETHECTAPEGAE